VNISAFQVKIELQGPILTGATNPGKLGIDTPFARKRTGELYLPGTLVKGKLRQAWGALSGCMTLPPGATGASWLGAASGNSKNPAESFEPARGRVHFSDFIDRSSAGRSALRSRIKMDEDRGSADDRMLQLLESPYAAGEQAVFEGAVYFFERDERERRVFMDALRDGLAAVPSFGAERGIGFGRLRSVKLSLAQPPACTPRETIAAGAETIGLILSGDESLCLAHRQPAENLFESGEIVSGAAIKGAMATMIEMLGAAAAFPLLSANLSRIRIRHARPGRKGAPPKLLQAIPYSMVFAAGDWNDVALRRNPCLIRGEAPAFQVDWKDREQAAASKYFEHCKAEKELRVRTQIDPTKRRALDENLFAYESVGTAGLEWRTAFDLYHVPADLRQGVCHEIETLLAHGIFGLGKTKARLDAGLCNSIPPRFSSSTTPAGVIVIQLQTPALLGLPPDWQTARNSAHVRDIYSRAWAEISNNQLVLSHYFAAQEMSGGLYLHRRFRPPGYPYQPWLLTSAGSVFVFEATAQPEVARLLDGWLQTGLPLAQSLRDHYHFNGGQFELWNECPFVPENGFGEIAVNLHLNWRDRVLEVEHA
jgi:hypothetical protein